jgi:U3 small nucleolar RNA-associated protein 14
LERPTPIPSPSSNESNPWLAREAVSKASRKRNELVVGKDSAVIEKSKHKLKKQAKKRDEEKEKAREDATVEISMSDVLTLGRASSPPPPSGQLNETDQDITNSPPPTIPSPKPNDSTDDSDANSEVEEQEKVLTMKGKANAKGLRAFEQRDLVALAFAGDNVVKVKMLSMNFRSCR